MIKIPVVCTLLIVSLASPIPAVAQSGAPSPSDLVRQANEQLLNQGNLNKLEEFFSSSYVNHALGDGLGPIREYFRSIRAAFPDLRVEVEILLAQGDMVAWRRTERGTFKADYRGTKATGRPVVWHGVVISRIKDGRIVEEWGVGDLATQIRR